MNHTTKTRRYVHIPKTDGINVRIPVSDFVLNLTKQPALVRERIRKVPFAQQITACALTLVLCASSFGMTHANSMGTLSYFRDDEFSRANLFAAGFLGFRVNPGDVTIPIQEGDTVTLSPLFAPLPDTFSIKYRVRAGIVGEDSPLCSLLHGFGTSSPYIYDGRLENLLSDPATTTGHGSLEVTLPNASGIANGTSCTIALEYAGWFEGAPENTGYTDKHRDTFTFVYNEASKTPVPAAAAAAETPATETPATEETNNESTTTPDTIEVIETVTPQPQESQPLTQPDTADQTNTQQDPPLPETLPVTDAPASGITE